MSVKKKGFLLEGHYLFHYCFDKTERIPLNQVLVLCMIIHSYVLSQFYINFGPEQVSTVGARSNNACMEEMEGGMKNLQLILEKCELVIQAMQTNFDSYQWKEP